tara:strand:- start:18816 stop:19613 length:798 start_codon:yes stop_codon:yes gene_type:complete
MSTLKKQIKELQNQINLSSNAQENETIIEANTDVLKRLNDSLKMLKRAEVIFRVMPLISRLDDQLVPRRKDVENTGYLIGEGSKFVLGDDIKSLLENAKESMNIFTDKWKDINFKAQQDESLNEFDIHLKNFSEVINSLNNKYWKTWLSNLENHFVVEEIVLEQQKTIPGKKDIYSQYNNFKARFDAGKVSKDVNSSLVSSLNNLKEELIKLRAQMDRSELPKDVAKFLKELDATWSTPTLELVTPNVFEWLRNQGLLTKLKVSR